MEPGPFIPQNPNVPMANILKINRTSSIYIVFKYIFNVHLIFKFIYFVLLKINYIL